jgi:hypothetical protein
MNLRGHLNNSEFWKQAVAIENTSRRQFELYTGDHSASKFYQGAAAELYGEKL